MSKINKSFNELLKENARLKKELAYYKNIKSTPHKVIDVKLSHNNFYLSNEWKELRYKKLSNYIIRNGKKCECCGNESNKLHVDHIQPRSKRPDLELSIDNLQVMCETCNTGKKNYDSVQWSKLKDEWDQLL